MTFIKNREDFVCGKCGEKVAGDGFTNHCPKCLWSKHVDINPGDREAGCNGMMKPVKFEKEKEEYIFTHRCEKCGHEKRNKISSRDDFDKAIEITRRNTQ